MMLKFRIVMLLCVVLCVSTTYKTKWYCNSEDNNMYLMLLILYIRHPTGNLNVSYHAFFTLNIVR